MMFLASRAVARPTIHVRTRTPLARDSIPENLTRGPPFVVLAIQMTRGFLIFESPLRV